MDFVCDRERESEREIVFVFVYIWISLNILIDMLMHMLNKISIMVCIL
jgi:hypothetical protein